MTRHAAARAAIKLPVLAAAILAFIAVSALAHADSDATFVDDAGRQVTVPQHIGKIFVAGPPAALLLYSLAPDMMLGWSQPLGDSAKGLLPARYAALPVLGRLTGHGQTVDPARLQELHPDLILDVGDVDSGYVALADKIQQQSGIPYVLMNGHLDHSALTYRRLGQLLGREKRAEALTRYAEHVLHDLPAAIKSARNATGSPIWNVYYGRGDDGLQSAGPGNINLDLIDLLGFHNVMTGHLPNRLTSTTSAEIAANRPEVILAQHQVFLAAIRNAPDWRSVPAVKEHRLYAQPLDPFGWADDPPGVNRLLGAQWLALQLCPHLHWPDLAKSVTDFYRLFYQIDLTPAQTRALLRQASAQ
ncbi:MAG TPA: ABC transporter substrate-binding protein [Dongiaceae bacterium]|nr:ABC transporter substrate-binding protein [Dongiaceae bacterium]